MVPVVDNSLRDCILEFEASIMAYSTTSVSDPHTRISFLISLDYWALSIINRLATCLININKGECREVLGLDFKKLTRKDYWLKGPYCSIHSLSFRWNASYNPGKPQDY